MGLSSFCSCTTPNNSETKMNNDDEIITYAMDRNAELKNIVVNYSKYWKQDKIDGLNDDYLYFRMSVPDSSIFITTYEANSNSSNPAKDEAERYSQIDKEAEIVESNEITVDDKPGYRVLIRHYSDESYISDYDDYNVFEHKGTLYCIDMSYSKEEKDIGSNVLKAFINEIELK